MSGRIILAAQDEWEQLGEHFQNREVSWETWGGLALTVLSIGLLFAFLKWWTTWSGNQARSGSWTLFRELAAGHGLGWGERRLLKQVAKAAGVPHPAHVFIDPSVYANQETATHLKKVWPAIMRIQQKLFA